MNENNNCYNPALSAIIDNKSLSKNEIRIALHIMRYSCSGNSLTHGQIGQALYIDKNEITRAIKRLMNKNVIIKEPHGAGFPNTYTLNENIEEWKNYT